MMRLLIILLLSSSLLSNIYGQGCPADVANYNYIPPSIKTYDYVNILYLLDTSNSMSQKAFDNNTTNENLGGYFKKDVEYCLDTEFNGATESLLGNLLPGVIGSIGDNQTLGLVDNASASSNEDSFPEFYMECGAPLVGELGNLATGLLDAIMGLLPSLSQLCISLTSDQLIAILRPFLQLVGSVLSTGSYGLGYQMNASKMARSDYVTRLLTGGKVQELGRCVSEGQNTCLGVSVGFLTGGNCCGSGCNSIDLIMILQLVLTGLDVLTTLGIITAGVTAVTASIQSVIAALQALQLSVSICLPKLLSQDNCTQYTTEDECTSSEDNCTWIERHAVVLADNNTAVKWSDADSFVEDSGGMDLIGQNNNLCNMALNYTINDNGTNDYIYEADDEITGCLEGILQDIQEWPEDKKPRLGGIIYSSDIDKNIGLNFDYTDLANAINETPVDSSTDDPTITSDAFSEAVNTLSADNASTFNVNNTNLTIPCTKNLVFYMSDGLWSDTDPIGNIHDAWLGGTADLNDSIAGRQNIETYAFNMNLGETDDTTVRSMKNSAIFGGYRDYDDSGLPCGYESMPQDSQNTDIPPSCYEWDGDLNGYPDNYFLYHEPNSYESLIESIFEMAVEGALEQHYNSTAPAAARFGDNKIGLWVNAFYFPKLIHEGLSANWRGDVQAYFLDEINSIRENDDNSSDTDEYKLFDLADNNTYTDNLITFTTGLLDNATTNQGNNETENLYSILVLNYSDTYDNLTPIDCNPYTKSLLQNQYERTSPVWSALLDQLGDDITLSGGRTIFLNDNETPAFTELDDSNYLFDNNTYTKDLVKEIWCTSDDSYIGNIISLIKNGKNGFLYGDIINSSPVIVPPTFVNNYNNKYNDLTYYDYINSPTVRNRLPIVIVGGNDGMVHAFYMGNPRDNIDSNELSTLGLEIKNNNYNQADYNVGQEIWAFMPYNVLPYLQWYNIEGSRYHIPKVDYTFRLVDAAIGENGNASSGGELTADSWRTVLIGTMGFGGKKYSYDNKTFSSSIFAIDVTGTDFSENLNNETNDNYDTYKPMFMWEKTLPDNTLIISTPAIVKYSNDQNGNTNGNWYVVVGTGPNNPEADNFTESGKIYFFNLKDGELVAETEIENYKAIGEVMEVDSDNNYSDDALFFGTYDNETGSFYAADITNDVGNAEITNILTDLNAPYFAKSENTFDEYGNIWVYASSGRLFSKNDMLKIDDLPDENIANQYIVALKFNRDDENLIEIENNGIASSNLYDATDTEVEADVASVSCYCAGVYLGPADNTTGGFNCNSYSCCNNNNEDGCEMVVDLVDNPRITTEGNIAVEEFARENFAGDNTAASYMGWYIDLKSLSDNNNYSQNENLESIDTTEISYERAYSAPSAYGGLVNCVTYTPYTRPCSVVGTTRLHSLHYMTGTPSGQITLMSGDNILDSTSTVSAGGTVTMSGSTIVGKEAMSLPPPTGKSMTSVKGQNGKVTTFVGSNRIEQQTTESSSGVTSRILFKKVR